MKKTAIISAALFLSPLVAMAQTSPASGIMGLINLLGTIINALIPLLIGAGIIVFFWGLLVYLRSDHKDKSIMIWGIVALFLMVSVWGIIRIAQSTLGIGGVQTLPVPKVTPGAIQGS